MTETDRMMMTETARGAAADLERLAFALPAREAWELRARIDRALGRWAPPTPGAGLDVMASYKRAWLAL